MTYHDAIPDVDPLAVPAPVWLLKGLLLFTFLLHIILMNIALGGSLATFAGHLLGRAKKNENAGKLAKAFSKALPVAAAFTVTLGVAPLLFVQVLYGPLFYSATILIAWPWLAVIGLVILGYYGFYLHSYRWDQLKGARRWVILGSALLFMAVGLIYTNAFTLMLSPEKLLSAYVGNPGGTAWNFGDATLIPRYLHFLVGSIGVTGMAIVLYGLRAMKADPAHGKWAVWHGAMWFVGATVLEIVVGIWFLIALPRDVMMLFMGGNALATILLGAAFLLPLLGIVLILQAGRAEKPGPLSWSGAVVLVLTLVVMVAMRDIVRDGSLAGKFDSLARTVDPQWGVIGIFVFFLVLALAAVGFMLREVARARSIHGR